MTYYDDRLDSVALHFFLTRKQADECVKQIADTKGGVWGEVLDFIFSSIPERLRDFYLLLQDDTRNKDQILGIMRNGEYSPGLYYLRVYARRHVDTYLLVELYDIFTSKYREPVDDSRAWEAIELGIAERHILYKTPPLEFTGESPLFSTMTSVVDLFHAQGKTWIIGYPKPPAAGGIKFLSTILLTHLGQLILHSSPIDLQKYAKSPNFRKPRAIKKHDVAMELVMQEYSAALGIYAEDPDAANPRGISSILEDYRYFHPLSLS